MALSLAHPELFSRILQKLQSNKALTRLNLLRIIQSICDASDEQGALINTYGLYDSIQKLAETDTAILVRDMASKLIKSCEEYDRLGKAGIKRRTTRRASASTTPPSPFPTMSIPPTPTSSRSTQSTYFAAEREGRSRSMINGNIPSRPSDRDESTLTVTPTTASGPSATPKSRLPRTTSGRSSRQSLIYPSPKKDEASQPSPTIHITSSTAAPNSRRRRLGADGRVN